jgi:hypothetical protein
LQHLRLHPTSVRGLAPFAPVLGTRVPRLIAKGTLKDSDPIELLEGLLVVKMSRSLAHDFAITAMEKRLHRLVPDLFVTRGQCAATFAKSEYRSRVDYFTGDTAPLILDGQSIGTISVAELMA